jgi:hypothetical protein
MYVVWVEVVQIEMKRTFILLSQPNDVVGKRGILPSLALFTTSIFQSIHRKGMNHFHLAPEGDAFFCPLLKLKLYVI